MSRTRRVSPTSLLENLSSFPYRRKEIFYHETSSTVSSASTESNRRYLAAQRPLRPLESVTCDPNASLISEDDDHAMDSPFGNVSNSANNNLYNEVPENIGDALQQWLRSVQLLMDSPEMKNLMCSSVHLAGSAGHLCFQAALLPVTMPLHITGRTCDMIVGAYSHLLSETGSILAAATKNIANCVSENMESENSNSQDSNTSKTGGIVAALMLPSRVIVNSAENAIGHVGTMVSSLVTPPVNEKEKQVEPAIIEPTPVKKLVDSTSSDNYLERLRLDYIPSDDYMQTPTKSNRSGKTSLLLLRVVDLDLKDPNDPASDRFFCIDLEADLCDEVPREQIFDSMVERGFSLLANHPTVRVVQGRTAKVVEPPMKIAWKSEGTSSKLLKKMAQVSTIERLSMLQKETLVWSGVSDTSEIPLFLARGVVPMSPREMLNLLWDNSRTPEYNNFCLGRKTIIELGNSQFDCKNDDDAFCRGSKVIQSETRVPFTSMSVFLNCLMHARSFEDGYVIVSRSVYEGPRGSSTEKVRLAEQKNEILWGINVLRRVPNHPHLTDMTSLSQVKSGMVPKFLVKKIGLMGIEDFFKNVRKATMTR
ncbi:hypothetical protein FisN_1Lh523 [Fistulifera solaris]|uniref:START domain-containing protein n=1 Tax=Fistulifera solaris TaxID=1519565 RepID=A0A1Z5K120_FISSO|nr:hypothetical protein FisN_1Lh523 [Fistulifera solaris]|eukprot:GAX20003.1 hypothetical protein FisN_1Lh523 [Fistulifera solaris]